MDKKEKNKYRMTLQFSKKDEEQIAASALLKEKGRKKSAYIAKAIKYYVEHNEGHGNEKLEIKEILTEILTEVAKGQPAKKSKPKSKPKILHELTEEEWHKMYSDNSDKKPPETPLQKPNIKPETPPAPVKKLEIVQPEPKVEEIEDTSDIDDFLSGLSNFM